MTFYNKLIFLMCSFIICSTQSSEPNLSFTNPAHVSQTPNVSFLQSLKTNPHIKTRIGIAIISLYFGWKIYKEQTALQKQGLDEQIAMNQFTHSTTKEGQALQKEAINLQKDALILQQNKAIEQQKAHHFARELAYINAAVQSQGSTDLKLDAQTAKAYPASYVTTTDIDLFGKIKVRSITQENAIRALIEQGIVYRPNK